MNLATLGVILMALSIVGLIGACVLFARRIRLKEAENKALKSRLEATYPRRIANIKALSDIPTGIVFSVDLLQRHGHLILDPRGQDKVEVRGDVVQLILVSDWERKILSDVTKEPTVLGKDRLPTLVQVLCLPHFEGVSQDHHYLVDCTACGLAVKPKTEEPPPA